MRPPGRDDLDALTSEQLLHEIQRVAQRILDEVDEGTGPRKRDGTKLQRGGPDTLRQALLSRFEELIGCHVRHG
jgi:hypothetical protein